MTLLQTIIFAGCTSSVRFTQYGGAARLLSAAAVARVYLLAALGFDRKDKFDGAQRGTLHYLRRLFFYLSIRVRPSLFYFSPRACLLSHARSHRLDFPVDPLPNPAEANNDNTAEQRDKTLEFHQEPFTPRRVCPCA